MIWRRIHSVYAALLLALVLILQMFDAPNTTPQLKTAGTIPQPVRMPRSPTVLPQIAVCTASKSRPSWRSLKDTALATLLIPSLMRTIVDEPFTFTLYLAFDHDDAFWRQHVSALPSLTNVSIKHDFYTTSEHKIPVNELTAHAYRDGADYIVRINDDTEFLTTGWASIGVAALAAFEPPNVGVVGPIFAEGLTAILTHDMVHRTHLDIFKFYYPPVFSAWWVDDWITRVYEPDRMRKLSNWHVAHHTTKHGTRYAVQHHESKQLEGEIERGRAVLSEWLTSNPEGERRASWTILLTVNDGYYDFFCNWWAHYLQLKMTYRVAVVTEDEAVHTKLSSDYPTLSLKRSSLKGTAAHNYDSDGYKAIVSTRAHHILRHLQAGENVLYTDVDTVWRSDPTQFIGSYDVIAQIDKLSYGGMSPYYCTGFMAIRSTAHAIALITKWNLVLQNKPQLNQPVFNRLLHETNGLKHAGFPSKQFPNGRRYFDMMFESERQNVVVVHNNFIVGHRAKRERFLRTGLWASAAVSRAKQEVKTVRPLSQTKTTIVLMGYSTRRLSNYNRFLSAYGSMVTVIDQIIIVWNNQKAPPPVVPANLLVSVVVRQAPRNSMNNRYTVSKLVRTSSVLTVDDDVLLCEALIHELVMAHVKTPNRLVGVDGRSYDSNGNYMFDAQNGFPTMALTKTLLIPVKFMEAYMSNTALTSFINTQHGHGCEDIAMNFVSHNISGNHALLIKMDNNLCRKSLPEPEGLSISDKGWPAKRTSCVRWMLNYFEPKRFLLFTSAGDKSNVLQWTGSDRRYDIIVVYYGEDLWRTPWRKEVDAVYTNRDTKFPNLLWYLRTHSIDAYDAVAVWDDDIVAGPWQINALFEEMQKNNIDVFTPCHTRGSFKSLLRHRSKGLRYINYIEMNAPMFKRQELLNFMDSFNPIIKGWGADIWYSHRCTQAKDCTMAVTDTTCVTNPKTRSDGTREIEKAQPERIRAKTWEYYAKNVLNISHMVPRNAYF